MLAPVDIPDGDRNAYDGFISLVIGVVFIHRDDVQNPMIKLIVRAFPGFVWR
jgi:hypothetical protein